MAEGEGDVLVDGHLSGEDMPHEHPVESSEREDPIQCTASGISKIELASVDPVLVSEEAPVKTDDVTALTQKNSRRHSEGNMAMDAGVDEWTHEVLSTRRVSVRSCRQCASDCMCR